MSEDLISRQAAINAIDFEKVYMTAYRNGINYGNLFEKYNKGLDDAIKAINAIPSAEKERNRKFIEIDVRYSDPEICTYPEYRGKPYYGIKYEEKGELFVGFGTYNPEVLSEYLRKYFISAAPEERTIKVENVHTEYISEGDFDIQECGDCGNCGETVIRGDKFCHECGAKLDWSEKE